MSCTPSRDLTREDVEAVIRHMDSCDLVGVDAVSARTPTKSPTLQQVLEIRNGFDPPQWVVHEYGIGRARDAVLLHMDADELKGYGAIKRGLLCGQGRPYLRPEVVPAEDLKAPANHYYDGPHWDWRLFVVDASHVRAVPERFRRKRHRRNAPSSDALRLPRRPLPGRAR